MEENKNMAHRDVPYLVYEATQARNERTIKKLIIVVVIAIALMFISNAIWLYAWMQYDYVSEETSYWQDGEGINSINTRVNGDMTYEPILSEKNPNETQK